MASRTLSDASGNEVPLWRSEFALLATFLRAPGRVLSREQLLDSVSGRRAEAFDRSIDVLVGRLRRKIEPDPKAPRLIMTVPGVGYKFTARPHVAPASATDTAPEAQAPAEVPPVRPAERRHITVLHCAIASAGALAVTLDPEDWHEIVAAFHACCSELVEKFGGALAQSPDDSVVAWFGYPEASEFDAERAVRAGLALIAAVPKLRADARRTFASPCGDCQRLGRGRGSPRDHAAATGRTGRAVEPRSGAGFASSGRCRVDRRQHAAAGSWTFRNAHSGPILAEGFAQPIEAWRVTDGEATANRFLALRAPELSPLVGRDEELELLSRRWEQAKAGRGRIVLIGGEPGIGKSRLLRAFEHAAFGRCRNHRAVLLRAASRRQRVPARYRSVGTGRPDSRGRTPRPKDWPSWKRLLATSEASDEQIGIIANLLAIRADGRHGFPTCRRRDARTRRWRRCLRIFPA